MTSDKMKKDGAEGGRNQEVCFINVCISVREKKSEERITISRNLL